MTKGTVTTLAVISILWTILTWGACFAIGHALGAHIGFTLFVIIEIRTAIATIWGRIDQTIK